MIKAEELRIGNYVSSKQYRVEQINSYQINQLFIYQNGGIVAEYYHNLSPIELTEEWLIKFGFEKIGSKCIKNEIEISSWFTFRFSETPLKVQEINYVHQLQNLYFALTNEELLN